MSKKPKLEHCYYAARKCPNDTWYAVKRLRALQWYMEYIVKSTERHAEALQDDIYGKRYYFQRIWWDDVDLLTAFDVPCIDANLIGVEFKLVIPQLLDNGNGTQSVTSGENSPVHGPKRITRNLLTYKNYKIVS